MGFIVEQDHCVAGVVVVLVVVVGGGDRDQRPENLNLIDHFRFLHDFTKGPPPPPQ